MPRRAGNTIIDDHNKLQNLSASSWTRFAHYLTTKWMDEFPCNRFSSIPRKLGQVHLPSSLFSFIRRTTQLMEKLGAMARVEIQALQLSRILAVVVDVAIFLPSLQVRRSAPPHLFSTVSRCFCVARANFCRPRRWRDLHCSVRRSALQAARICRSASLGPGPLCVGACLLRILIGGSPISCTLERGQPPSDDRHLVCSLGWVCSGGVGNIR